MKYPGERKRRKPGPLVPKAGPVKITKADGSTHVEPPMSFKEAKKVIGSRRGRRARKSE